MKGLHRLWAGELPLHDAFWGWAVIGGITVNLLTTLAFFILLTMDMLVAAFVAGYCFSVPYNVVVAVGVWRSAGRMVDQPTKANVYRIVTVVWMTLLSLLA